MAIVSDIHGSLAAFDAVADDIRTESVDLVAHAGDLALSGPRPAEVIDRIRELEWPGVVGNTDELLWRPEEYEARVRKAPRLKGLLRVLFEALAPATAEAVGTERIAWLQSLPRERTVEGDVVVLHASPGDLWRAPMPDADDSAFDETYASVEARVIAYGHIHRPFARRVSGRWVANSGSVGMSYDGDPRASYLLVDDDNVVVKRVAYDVERDIAALHAVRYPLASWLAEIRRSGRYIAPPEIGDGS
jgi:predicted phosphodiesterase